ncbi:MAG: hypothetical protein HYR71_10030 [Chloroflexi bacterium]|nr:hypothetical protein [Chloroflexota bacterium]
MFVDALWIVALYALWLAAAYTLNALTTGARTPQAIFEAWVRFDGIYFRAIAEDGYAAASRLIRPEIGFTYLTAFFPLFPLAVHLAAPLVNSNTSAATILVPQALTCLSLLALFRLVTLDFSRRAAWWSVLSLMTFTTSTFLISGYSESLFLLLAVLTFYGYRRGRFAMAGLTGALACAARIVGPPLVFGAVLLDVAAQKRDEWRVTSDATARPESRLDFRFPIFDLGLAIKNQESKIEDGHSSLVRRWPLALMPLGFAAYAAYLWWTFGDPTLFLKGHASSEWRIGFDLTGPLKGLLLPFFTLVFRDWSSEVFRANLFNSLFFYFAIGMMIYGWRKLPFVYSAYALLAIFTPTLTGSLISMPRFLLVSFPLFISMGLLFDAHPRARLLLAPLALSSLAATVLFFRTVFLG